MPQNSNFRFPRGHRFLQNMEVTVMAPNHGGDTIQSILGPMGSHWVKKMGQNRKKLPCPQIRIFDYPAVIDFSQKMEVKVMALNHSGEPLGSILGPVGSYWVKKWVKTAKNYHAPKFEFSITPLSSVFRKKWRLRLWRQITVGTPSGPSWGQWGPIGSKKWVKTVKNYHAPKFEFSITPRSSVFRKKWKLRLWRQITVGNPSGPSWGQWFPTESKKWVKTVKNYHAPKFEFSITPRSSVFRKKWKLQLLRQITAGTP